MTSTYHDDYEYELTESMPGTAERVSVVWKSRTQADGAKGGYAVEKDGVEVEAWRWDCQGCAFDDAYQEIANEEPPGV